VNEFDEFTDIAGTPSKQLESYKYGVRQSNMKSRRDLSTYDKFAGFDRLQKKNEFM